MGIAERAGRFTGNVDGNVGVRPTNSLSTRYDAGKSRLGSRY
jgi:hypothetical protein